MPGQGQATSDLWLVGGDLAQWRCSRGAPPMDAEVWLWDGELCGQQTLKVQAGALSRHGWRRQDGGECCVSIQVYSLCLHWFSAIPMLSPHKSQTDTTP